MSEERCVSCGAIIPEGRQICVNCSKDIYDTSRPCLGCLERTSDCHGRCVRYAKYRERLDAKNERIKAYKKEDDEYISYKKKSMKRYKK